MRRGEINEDIAETAWRAGEWELAADAYGQLADNDNKNDSGFRMAISALMAGENELPDGARQALADDPDALDAVSHMFSDAPEFDFENADDVAEYASSISKEMELLRKGLNNE